jgi:PAS domain S-box-containing protein
MVLTDWRKCNSTFNQQLNAIMSDNNGFKNDQSSTDFDVRFDDSWLDLEKSKADVCKEIIETTRDAIFALNRDGKYLFVNNSFAKSLGKTPDEIIGKSPHDFFSHEEAEKRISLVHQVFRTGERAEIEVNFEDASGGTKVLITGVDPVKNKNGNVKYVTCVSKDITERKGAEGELVNQNAAISKLNRFSLELSMLPADANLEVFISKWLKEIAGAKVVTFSDYDHASRTTTARHIEIDPGLTGTVIGILGKKIGDVHSLVSEQMYQEMTTDIIGMRRTLYEACFGAVPRPVAAAIQALLKADRFFGMAYLVEGKLYGTSLMAMAKGQPDPPKQILENFSLLAGMSLRRKLAEENLKASEEKFRLAFITSPDSVNISRLADGMYVSINPGFTRIMGYTEDDIIGKTSIEFSIWGNNGDRQKLVEGLKNDGTVTNLEATFITKSGHNRYGLMSSSVIDLNGVPHILCVTRDITERKLIEKALVAKERLAAIGELASSVAHDFNNAFQKIIGCIECALLEEDLPGEIREDLNSARQTGLDAAERSKKLRQNACATVEFRKFQIVDIKSVVAGAIEQTQTLWKDKVQQQGLKIEVESNCPDDMTILGNPGELRTALYNLIKNSIEAMPKGGTITIDAKMIKSEICLSVKDTGIGMDYETKQRIYEPFFTTKSLDQGRGLGMGGVANTIEDHKGRINIISAPGRGTTIELWLPFASTETSPSVRTESGLENIEPLKVIWVEDEDIIRRTSERLMLRLGHKVDAAAGGAEALKLLETNQYDLMITDVGMPGMSGHQLIEIIRKKYPDTFMEIVVASGGGNSIPSEQEYELGVKYLLNKPFQIKNLKEIISKVAKMKK